MYTKNDAVSNVLYIAFLIRETDQTTKSIIHVKTPKWTLPCNMTAYTIGLSLQTAFIQRENCLENSLSGSQLYFTEKLIHDGERMEN